MVSCDFCATANPEIKSERLEFAANISFVFPGRESQQQFSEQKSRGDKDLAENVYYNYVNENSNKTKTHRWKRRGKCQHTHGYTML